MTTYDVKAISVKHTSDVLLSDISNLIVELEAKSELQLLHRLNELLRTALCEFYEPVRPGAIV